VLPDVLALGEHPPPAHGMSVRDLAVTADHDQMYLVSLSRRCVVEPVVAHSLVRHQWPVLARLLFELPRACSSAVSLFDWGPARCLPFRPRVRYGRAILSAARWRVRREQLPDRAAAPSEWVSALSVLRERLGLPAMVYVGTGDRRLRLNLDDAADQVLFREHVAHAADAVTVMEAPDVTDYGWFDGRAHEIVIPLISTRPPTPTPTVVTRAGPLRVADRDDAQLPGSSVLFARLYGHPDVFDLLLTRHLPELLASWTEPPRWWFVRYRTPSPHLRLRLRQLADYGQAADRVGRWAVELRRHGLVGDLTLDTYHPETARYGTGQAMAAAEDLFCADSRAVVAQLSARSADLQSEVVTARSLIDLAEAMLGGHEHAIQWLMDHRELAGSSRVGDRAAFRRAVDVATDPTLTRRLLGDGRIALAWAERRDAARVYRHHLASSHVTPSSVLTSLLHMHCVRAHGIAPNIEARCHRLARAVALSWNARHDDR
jgi:thiopeptide-type bacteriocin biosynthesis protein